MNSFVCKTNEQKAEFQRIVV